MLRGVLLPRNVLLMCLKSTQDVPNLTVTQFQRVSAYKHTYHHMITISMLIHHQ